MMGRCQAALEEMEVRSRARCNGGIPTKLKKRGREWMSLMCPKIRGLEKCLQHTQCQAFTMQYFSVGGSEPQVFPKQRHSWGDKQRMWKAIRYNCISQYHNVAPSFPLNEILVLQLPSKNLSLLSVLSLAEEQLCNPSQITFCCSGMREGIWDSCLLNYCSLKAAMVIVQGSGCSLRVVGGAPMSPCASSTEGPCPHWHRDLLVMHWGFKNQNNAFCPNAYSQECSASFSQAGTLCWVFALWWLMASRSYLRHQGPAESSWWNVGGFHRIMHS